MTRRVESEIKIIGTNFFIVSAAFTTALIVLSAISGELLIMYFPPAFFLSSLCALFGIYCTGEHIATLACGVVWLIILLIRSLLRISGAEYIYLFIRYADEQNPVWLWNKCIVTTIGLFLWGIIYLRCKKPISTGL